MAKPCRWRLWQRGLTAEGSWSGNWPSTVWSKSILTTVFGSQTDDGLLAWLFAKTSSDHEPQYGAAEHIAGVVQPSRYPARAQHPGHHGHSATQPRMVAS